jgi:hypothetical protein
VKSNTTNLLLKPKRVDGTTELPRFENASAPLVLHANYLHGEQTLVGLRPERPCLLIENQRYLFVSKGNILRTKWIFFGVYLA